jgi:hypothetical protein
MCVDLFRFYNHLLNHQTASFQYCHLSKFNKVCGMWKTKFSLCRSMLVQCSLSVDRWQQLAIKWKWCLCSYPMVLIHFSQRCSRIHCVILVLLSVAVTGERAKSLCGAHKSAYGVTNSFHTLKRSGHYM